MAQKEIEDFYDSLAEIIEKCRNMRTESDDTVKNIVDKHGLGIRNERGELLIELCAENRIFITNIYFQHHLCRRLLVVPPMATPKNKYVMFSSIQNGKHK